MKALTPLKALTIDAPWAWAIIAGHKRVENRTWRTKHRGPLAIHAGLSKRSDAIALALFAQLDIKAPTERQLDSLRGRLLGLVELIDVWEENAQTMLTESPRDEFGAWWVGPIGWELKVLAGYSERPLVKGAQSLWSIDDRLVAPLDR